MERAENNINSKSGEINTGPAFAQLQAREKELERMNEIQVNLAITLFPDEEDVSASMTKWILSELSKEFRSLIDDLRRNSRNTKI
jgi:hypothetical protein